jgi:hypothetical protein
MENIELLGGSHPIPLKRFWGKFLPDFARIFNEIFLR